MEIEVRKAMAQDCFAIWTLVKELAVYERAPNEVTTSPEIFERDMAAGRFHAFVALEDGDVVAMALFYPIYSTWKGLSYYLEDIIVKETYRRRGVGSKLFEAVLRFCKEQNAGRLGWQVLEWNQSAIDFYKKYNAEFDNEWITCRIRDENMGALINQ